MGKALRGFVEPKTVYSKMVKVHKSCLLRIKSLKSLKWGGARNCLELLNINILFSLLFLAVTRARRAFHRFICFALLVSPNWNYQHYISLHNITMSNVQLQRHWNHALLCNRLLHLMVWVLICYKQHHRCSSKSIFYDMFFNVYTTYFRHVQLLEGFVFPMLFFSAMQSQQDAPPQAALAPEGHLHELFLQVGTAQLIVTSRDS